MALTCWSPLIGPLLIESAMGMCPSRAGRRRGLVGNVCTCVRAACCMLPRQPVSAISLGGLICFCSRSRKRSLSVVGFISVKLASAYLLSRLPEATAWLRSLSSSHSDGTTTCPFMPESRPCLAVVHAPSHLRLAARQLLHLF
ncbi:hypothetical protein BC827DRAFT_634643 [Russula dissimulans]|nr:hypothetical protein BC827DRAFT_634643 [Russula dissimulans]